MQGIGGAQDAARMQRVVNFYEKLPRGAAPEVKPSGLLGRYQARYFGKKPSAMRTYTDSRDTALLCSVQGEMLTATVSISYRPSHRWFRAPRLCAKLLFPSE